MEEWRKIGQKYRGGGKRYVEVMADSFPLPDSPQVDWEAVKAASGWRDRMADLLADRVNAMLEGHAELVDDLRAQLTQLALARYPFKLTPNYYDGPYETFFGACPKCLRPPHNYGPMKCDHSFCHPCKVYWLNGYNNFDPQYPVDNQSLDHIAATLAATHSYEEVWPWHYNAADTGAGVECEPDPAHPTGWVVVEGDA
jgi:hypothetical protein